MSNKRMMIKIEIEEDLSGTVLYVQAESLDAFSDWSDYFDEQLISREDGEEMLREGIMSKVMALYASWKRDKKLAPRPWTFEYSGETAGSIFDGNNRIIAENIEDVDANFIIEKISEGE